MNLIQSLNKPKWRNMREQIVSGFYISDDKKDINLLYVHKYLSEECYWSIGRNLDIVNRSIENSLCFGIYTKEAKQIAFARVVTDYSTFAWVCDVFVDKEFQGKDLSKNLIKYIIKYPALQGLKRLLLATKDAHILYKKYGEFSLLTNPEMWMERNTLS